MSESGDIHWSNIVSAQDNLNTHKLRIPLENPAGIMYTWEATR